MCNEKLRQVKIIESNKTPSSVVDNKTMAILQKKNIELEKELNKAKVRFFK